MDLCRKHGISEATFYTWRKKYGAPWVSHKLMLEGIQVSSGGVRGFWNRNGLLPKPQGLMRLEKTASDRRIELRKDEIRRLERFHPEFRDLYIDARHTGSLVAVETF